VSRPSLAERVRAVDGLVLDVDGVLTDGRIVYADDGAELKFFHVRDGSGLKLWQLAGKRAAVVSGRRSKVVEVRAMELGLSPVVQGAADKLPALAEVLAAWGLPPERVAAVGDDLPDLPVLRSVGVGIAVGDACPELAADADYVTTARGGRGAVREAVEWLLKAQGHWPALAARYRVPRPGEEA
jgi:3-deoxy-D-manno-octulosonate 8-phosphate phosphatase (KDO 8-P phosphatase)